MPIDYNKYPADWFGRLHRIVWDRAKGCCEECGLAHGAEVWSHKVPMYRGKKRVYRAVWTAIEEPKPHPSAKIVKVVLTKAHLDHDADNKNVHPSRLRLWCQLDHLRYDAHQKAYQRAQKARDSGNRPEAIGSSYRPVAHRFE